MCYAPIPDKELEARLTRFIKKQLDKDYAELRAAAGQRNEAAAEFMPDAAMGFAAAATATISA